MEKVETGLPMNEHDLVFPNETGEPINSGKMLQRHFLPGLEAAGLPKNQIP
jgi:hypothetical protein